MAKIHLINASRSQDMPLAEASSILNSFSLTSKDDTHIQVAIASLIKNVRKKDRTKEKILSEFINVQGLLKIYNLFNASHNARVRKLSGRLICELTFNSEHNQNVFTEMFSFSPVNGKVCLNQGMPDEIKLKLASDPSYLEVLRTYQDKDYSPSNRRYWCFPQYIPEASNEFGAQDLERSVTPNRGTEVVIDNESMEDYLKFPDSHKYLIGFICGQHQYQVDNPLMAKSQPIPTSMRSHRSKESKHKDLKKDNVQEISSAQWYQTLTAKISKEFREEARSHKKNQFSIQTSQTNQSSSQASSQSQPTVRTQSNKKTTEEQQSSSNQDSPYTFNVLMKKLNKPEMLLLNHLQNQIKMYYPDQAKKHKWLQQELGLNEDPLQNVKRSFDPKLSSNNARKSSEQQMSLLPVSLKAKMKNLIQTLEKEQLIKKRPNSLQKNTNDHQFLIKEQNQNSQQIKARESSLKPQSIQNRKAKLSENLSHPQQQHLSTQSHSPIQQTVKDGQQRVQSVQQRSFSPLFQQKRMISQRDQKQQDSKGSRTDSLDSEGIVDLRTNSSNILKVNSKRNIPSNNNSDEAKMFMQVKVTRNPALDKSQHHHRKPRTTFNATMKTQRYDSSSGGQSAYVKVLDRMKNQLKKNGFESTAKRNEETLPSGDQPLINLTSSSRESSNKQAVVSAVLDTVTFFS